MAAIRLAVPEDMLPLMELLRAFYVEERLAYTAGVQSALAGLLEAPARGVVFLIATDAAPPSAANLAGYFVLTYGYSLERGGKTALLDELYIDPAHRRKGLATVALAHAATAARAAGCAALHVEVQDTNRLAANLYARAGFQNQHRQYLTLTL